MGTGKAAHFFSRLFFEGQLEITEIIGRSYDATSQLAEKVSARPNNSGRRVLDTDLILLAVKDDAISSVLDSIEPGNAIIAHCAGAVDMQVLNRFDKYGVLYPLQSLSDVRQVKEVPILYEANSSETEVVMHKLLSRLELNMKAVDSARRKTYHLAAVFANNFSNAMLDATYQLSQRYQLDFDLLKPLIRETFMKVIEGGVPSELQTGPASRGDELTMQGHLAQLENEKDLKGLYQAISEFIAIRVKP